MATISEDALPKHHKATQGEKMVIAASSLGTVFEWYDFYLYGLLATYISVQFFSGVNETTGFIFALAAFAAGFAVRPFGALVFGRIGDIVGRKNTFLVTMGIMGLSTFAVGLLPSYASIGVAAPIILVALRLAQDWLWAENMAALPPMSPNMPPRANGAFTPADPDHRHLRPVCSIAGGHRHPLCAGRRGIRSLGLAPAVPDLDLSAGHFDVDPPAAERESGLPEDEG